MKKNTHFVVPRQDFELLQGQEQLTLYQVHWLNITMASAPTVSDCIDTMSDKLFGDTMLSSSVCREIMAVSITVLMLYCLQFNTKQAKHLFCKVCGVQSFYIPRSNPDGYAITATCIDPGTITKLTVEDCDGENWEKFFETEQERFNAMSKAR